MPLNLGPEAEQRKQCQRCFIPQSQMQAGRLLTCARCKRWQYCSKACQKADWARHKPLCKTTLAHLDEVPPEERAATAAIERVLKKWIQIFRPALESFAKLALNCYETPERMLDTVFCVNLHVHGDNVDAFPPERAFTLCDAVTEPADAWAARSSNPELCRAAVANHVSRCLTEAREVDQFGYILCIVTVAGSYIMHVVTTGVATDFPGSGWRQLEEAEWKDLMRSVIAKGIMA